MKKTCSAKNCNNKHYGKGYCKKHYLRLKRNGTLDLKQYNTYHFYDNDCFIEIDSPTYGLMYSVINVKDFPIVRDYIWYIHKDKRSKTFYVITSINNKKIKKLHQILNPTWKETDHWDRNGLNNRRNNLRECNRSENTCNQGVRKDNTSGKKGVSFSKKYNKFHAYINKNGKRHNLGYFNTAEEAALARDKAAKKYHGPYAYFNFP